MRFIAGKESFEKGTVIACSSMKCHYKNEVTGESADESRAL